jgi:hypothetical protein
VHQTRDGDISPNFHSLQARINPSDLRCNKGDLAACRYLNFNLAAEAKLSAHGPCLPTSRPGLHPERAEPPLTEENRSWNSQTWDAVTIKPKLPHAMGELVTSDDKNAVSAPEKSPRTPRRRRTPKDESSPSRLPAGSPSRAPSPKFPPTVPAKRRKTFHFRLPGRSSTRLSQVASKIQDVGTPKTPNSHNPAGGGGTPKGFPEVAVPSHARLVRPGRVSRTSAGGATRITIREIKNPEIGTLDDVHHIGDHSDFKDSQNQITGTESSSSRTNDNSAMYEPFPELPGPKIHAVRSTDPAIDLVTSKLSPH